MAHANSVRHIVIIDNVKLPTGLAGIGTFAAHLRALFAAVFRTFVAKRRTFATKLFAEHTDFGSQRRFLLM